MVLPKLTTTYVLFRKSLNPAGRLSIPPIPSHLEFLIDRQGYIRARWLLGMTPGGQTLRDL